MTGADAAGPSYPPIVGRRRYEILRRLGAGGMAEVFLCKMHAGEGVSRTVAVKLIREEYAKHPSFRTALAQEAHFASSLVHSNVVAVLDFDQDERERLFLVMDYVDGVDLWKVSTGHALPPSVAIHIAAEVLTGLAYAHAPRNERRGIVHRDVSPQNVLLNWHGVVKLADFGIAKAITTSGALSGFRGKAAYMSPEQAAQLPIDARSDLFSLGVVLWELVTGCRLFEGRHPKDLLTRIILGPIPAPSSVRPIRADLEAVILRLLAKQRDDRYPNAQAAIAALLACHDAPRNGPRELMEYLSMRFPDGSSYVAALTSDVRQAQDRSATSETAVTGDETMSPTATEGATEARSRPPLEERAGPLTRWLQHLYRRL
jgi:serine/threonine protein kinase